MTDATRNLLISLSSHMAYMQGQLEAHHELHNPENAYWYRESVLLRQKVTDALADEPAVPAPPADGEVAELVAEIRHFLAGYQQMRGLDPEHIYSIHRGDKMEAHITVSRLTRTGKLLQRQALVPVSVSERMPGDQLCWWFESDEDGESYGSSWTLLRIRGGVSGYTHWLPAHALPLPEASK